MRPGHGYGRLDSSFPLMGLDSVSPTTQMNPKYSPDLLNMMIRDSVYVSRAGYDAAGSALNGTVVLVEEYIGSDGTKTLVVVTTTREYKYVGVSDSWTEITAGFTPVAELNDNGAAVDTIVLTGDFTLTYVSGSKITITDSGSGNDGTYTLTIDSTEAGGETTCTVATGTLAATENPAPGACRARQDKTGTELDVVDSAQGTDANGTYLFTTNDVDFPRYWNGSGVFKIADDVALNYTDFDRCKTLEIIDDYLVLGNVYTGSDNQRTLAFSDTLDFFEHTTGNSFVMKLTDAIGEIKRVLRLADNAAIYSENSIHLLQHIGGDALFGAERMFAGLAPAGPRAIVDLGAFHIFLGQEKFWVFDGTRLVRPFGQDTIAAKVRISLDDEYRERVLGFNDVPHRHAYFVVPTTATTSLTFVVEYDISDFRKSKWMIMDYTDRPTGFGYYSRHDDMTWQYLSTYRPTWTWQQVASDLLWGDRSIKKGFPSRVMASTTQVYLSEDTYADDNGVAFVSREDSIDFTVPEAYLSINGRWIELEIELRGDTIDVEYSADLGTSWTFAKDSDGADADGKAITADWTKYKFYIDVVSETMRIRLSCPDISTSFSRQWLGVWVRAGGSR